MTVKQAFDGADGLNRRRYELMNLVSRSRNQRTGKTNPTVKGTWAQTAEGYLVHVEGRRFPTGAVLDIAVHRMDGQIGHVRGARAVGWPDTGGTLFRPPRRKTAAEKREEREEREAIRREYEEE